LAIVFLLANFSFVFTQSVYATTGINRTINFQGKVVKNSDGTNVANGTIKMVFSFYNLPSSGAALWTETQNSVPVTDGIFRAVLGSQNAFPANFNFNWDGLYLGVTVGTDSEMTPRIQMASVPFAFNAQQVAGLTVLDSASGVGNTASTSATLRIGTSGTSPITVDLGVQNLKFETTATTDLKLPTSGTVISYLDTAQSGTLASITSATNQNGAETGLAITMGTATAQTQYGIQFALSGTGALDLRGTSGNWSISSAGALHIQSCDNCTAGGPPPFSILNGLLYNGNLSTDFAIGGNSSTSAKFKISISGTNPTASVSAQTSYAGLVVDNSGAGDLITASSSGLTLFTVTKTGSLNLAGNTAAINFTGTGINSITTAINANFAINPGGSGLVGINTDGTAPLANFDVRANVGTIAIASISGQTSYAGLTVDNSGVGDLITASTSGATKFVVRQNGSVGIGGSLANSGYKLDVLGSARISGNSSNNDDIVKDTTADFTQGTFCSGSGYCATNVNTAGNDMSMIVDTHTNAAAPSGGPSTVVNVASASAIMRRPDGKLAVLGGVTNGSNLIYIYSIATNTFTVGPSLTSNIGSGSAVFQRGDGKFVIVYGNRVDIYDPAGSNNVGNIVAQTALPSADANHTYVAGGGSRVIPRSDGKFLILMGGSQFAGLYDPNLGTVVAGPAMTTSIASGSAVFQRPDGKWMVIMGAGVSGAGTQTTNIYDPVTNTFAVGPSLQSPAGIGANVLQLPDGRFLVIDGNNSKNADVYTFATNSFTANNNLDYPVGTGSHAFQRPDNKWVIVAGNGSKNVDIYDPTSGATGGFSPAALLPNYVGVGGGAFQRDDGTYLILNGQMGTNSTVYDVGWKTNGVWTSEDITSTKISTYSAIFWDSSPSVSASPSAGIEMYVKTAQNGNLATANYNLIQNNGDLIQTVGMASQLKIQIQFNSPVAPPYNQVVGTATPSNMWASEGSTEYMRQITTPSLYDLKIQNPLAGYGGVLASDSTEDRNAATQSAIFDGTVTSDADSVTLATSRISGDASSVVIASASANLGIAPGAGANVLQLPNGKFLIVAGGGLTTKIYDSTTGLFSVGPNLISAAGAGTFSIPLPDGRFLITQGGGTGTNIYDPVKNIVYAGPTLTIATGAGAHAIQRSDGRFVFLMGSTTVTNIYDPFLNSIVLGPVTPANIVAGSLSVKRPDGRYVTFIGASLNTAIYEETSNTFIAGSAMTVANNAGAQAVQMSNGNWFIFNGGGVNTTKIYDSRTGVFTVGPVATGLVTTGTVAIPLPDGKIWYNIGANITAYILDPLGNGIGVQVASVPESGNLGAGTVTFQRPDGKWVILVGTLAGGNTLIVDAGWNTQGTYTTEPINNVNISANTSLDWKNTGQGVLTVQSRTGASLIAMTSAAWNDVEKADSLINPTNGDTFAQFRFTFNGIIPNNPYEKERVFAAADSGGAVAYYRGVQAPILQYWRMLNTADPNILTLTSENTNAFRFAADGQAYTAAGGAWNSGGADLAERYTSSQDLQAGEVVVGDQSNAQNVIRSTTQYQSNIMGVVSTSPGFVAGAYTPDSYPIALVGRVPVKISTENGPIHSGDYLTSASIPGYAMKATVAGRVLGTALQDFDPSDPTQVSDCPKIGAGSLITTQCGTITAFINLTSYNGQSVELAMADANFTNPNLASDSAGLSDIQANTGLDSYMNQVSANDQNTLAYLESLRDAGSAAFDSSEVFTGKVVAGEVISPNIVADLITAKTIRADHIEGLEILTNQLSALSNSVAVLSDATQSGELAATASAQLPSTLNLSSLNVNGLATISADLNIQGNGFIQGALNVLDNITTNNLLVSQFAYFINDVVFKGNVRFNGTPTFNSDTAGFAVIKQGQDTVQITFDNEYANTPVVTASIALDKVGDAVVQKQLEDAILNGNISYVITQRTTKGFIIRLSKPAAEDLNFSWVALSVQNAKTSGLNLIVTPEPLSTQSAAFQSILDQIETPSPTPMP